MLLGNNKDLENILLLTLSNNKVSTVPQLITELNKKNFKPTIQGVYRVLRKLQLEGVIVKERENYTIRIPWILDMGEFIKSIEDKYLKSQYFQGLIPIKEKEKKSWTFKDIFKLNDFWSQLILIPIKNSKEKVLLNYTPHAWFHLIQTHQEYQYIKTSTAHLNKTYTVIGGKDYLDEWATQFWKDHSIEYFLAPKEKWLLEDRTKYINVIDEYVFTVKLDPNITKEIDHLYQSIKNPEQLNIQNILSIFQTKIKAKITLEKNSKLATEYKKKFTRLFGPIQSSRK
jgi:hypothetical protein